MYGLTRGTMTLLGAAVAGFLLWLATQFEVSATGEYWAWLGILAAAGLTIALSQLLGGWTKWGWPRISGSVFLLGFLPALVAGGLVLLSAQPDDGAFGRGWAADVGLESFATDLTGVLPALAFGLGLLFGLTFDTTGPRPRAREVAVAREPGVVEREGATPVRADGRRAEDDPVTAERTEARTEVLDRDRDGVDDRDEARDRDRDGVDDRWEVGARTAGEDERRTR